MNVKRFWEHFNTAKRELKSFNFTDDALYNLASELAFKLIEVDLKEKEMAFKEKEMALNCAKFEKELETLTLKTKTEIKHIEIETLKSLVQAESMVRSVGDNAVINRANAYVGFLNVVGNASEGGAIAGHAGNVIAEIRKISDASLNNSYNGILKTLRDNLLASFNKNGSLKECAIIAPKLDIKINEPLECLGFSIFNKNEHHFLVNNQVVLTGAQTYLFQSAKPGRYTIMFRVKNDLGQWLADAIVINVTS